MGTGKQWMPWVALEDVLGLLYVFLMEKSISGACECGLSQTCTKCCVYQGVGYGAQSSDVYSVPKMAIKTLFGEMGQTYCWKVEKFSQLLHRILGLSIDMQTWSRRCVSNWEIINVYGGETEILDRLILLLRMTNPGIRAGGYMAVWSLLKWLKKCQVYGFST